MNSPLPEAVVFDLDYTLWPCWCDTHLRPPFKSKADTIIIDASGSTLELFKDVPSILKSLKEKDVVIIGASRTARPDIALQLLRLYKVDNEPMIKFFDSLQWGQGSKTKHIKKAIKELGMKESLDKGSIILFDDELRNQDVRSINCRFCHIEDDERGLTKKIFEKAIKDWNEELKL